MKKNLQKNSERIRRGIIGGISKIFLLGIYAGIFQGQRNEKMIMQKAVKKFPGEISAKIYRTLPKEILRGISGNLFEGISERIPGFFFRKSHSSSFRKTLTQFFSISRVVESVDLFLRDALKIFSFVKIAEVTVEKCCKRIGAENNMLTFLIIFLE